MGVHVAGGHALDAQPPAERGQRPVARAVVTGVGALQLDPQTLRAEGVEQPSRGRLVVHAPLGAAGQADQALGMLQHRLQGHRRLAALASLARVGVRGGENPAEVAPTPRVADQQRQMASAGLTAMQPCASRPCHRRLRSPTEQPEPGRSPPRGSRAPPISPAAWASSIEPDTEL